MKKILVLANDAGGSETLSAMVRAERGGYEWTVIAPTGSPASRIFRSEDVSGRFLIHGLQKISAEFLESLEFDLVLYNPGWNQFPQAIVSRLHTGTRKKVAILDHWIDYRERFGYPNEDWRRKLPDFIAVTDSKAYKQAQTDELPGLVKLKNYRVGEQLQRFGEIERAFQGKPEALLFLSQTVSAPSQGDVGDFTYIGGSEEQVLRELFDRFKALAAHFGVNKLKIRLHPAESQFRFTAIAQQKPNVPFEIEPARDRDLLESIAGARLVIGMNSMALFTAYVCGKPAVSLISNPNIRCTLPLPVELCISGIDHIFHLDFGKLPALKDEMNYFSDFDFKCLVQTAVGDNA